jgi:hypothetical protein
MIPINLTISIGLLSTAIEHTIKTLVKIKKIPDSTEVESRVSKALTLLQISKRRLEKIKKNMIC